MQSDQGIQCPPTQSLDNTECLNEEQIKGWAQDSHKYLKPLFRGNFDPSVNYANLGAIAHTSNGT